jgi:hypothetical protein
MGLDGVIEGRFMGERVYLLLRLSLRVERRTLGARSPQAWPAKFAKDLPIGP